MRELNLVEQTNVSGGFLEVVVGAVGGSLGYDRNNTCLVGAVLGAALTPFHLLDKHGLGMAIALGVPGGFVVGAALAYVSYSITNYFMASPAVVSE